ncbi:MAG: hypothetical protein QNJ53_26080 [Pleurocapsa sp. MO_192.B19]|nr:hypothetical protein [Pleurocapsa sp. MO_192.B19]
MYAQDHNAFIPLSFFFGLGTSRQDLETILGTVDEHQQLQARHDQLQQELIKLHFPKSPQLPSFLSRS